MDEINIGLVRVEPTSTSLTANDVEKSRKRSVNEKEEKDDELVPVLIWLPSDSPSCSSSHILIDKDQFKIGRKPDNDEVILNVLISRNHCILQRDKTTNGWSVKNLSSTDTLLNDILIERNKTEPIKDGDILQLSLSHDFRYKFTFIKKNFEFIKHPRLEPSKCNLSNVLNKQRSFVELQENERKDLEKQLNAKHQEQEQLKQELEKLLQDQKVTKTCNEELNNQIAELQKKIEKGNTTELELQHKYRDLLQKLEEERLKFEEKLAEEKQKWQEALKESKYEKEQLEMTMVEQMEEWREKLEKQQQAEWQKKIDSLLQEEKSVQTKLQDEKQLLEQKVKEMEEVLKERERQEEQTQRNAAVMISPAVDIQNCIIVELDSKNVQALPILETIDLTGGNDSLNTFSNRSCEEEAVIDKVNHIMDEQLTCSICSELFVRAMTMNCTHTFCRHCIDMWIKKNKVCPLCPNCRTPIKSMTRSLVVDNFIEKMLESLTPEQMERRKQLIRERQAKPIIIRKKR